MALIELDRTLSERLRTHTAAEPARHAYTYHADGQRTDWDRTTLNQRVDAVAAALSAYAPGERALLLFPSGLDFIAAFLGSLRAGLLAVPAYPPEPLRALRSLDRLGLLAEDCRPSVILTDRSVDALLQRLSNVPSLQALRTLPRIVVEQLEDQAPQPTRMSPDGVAFLQYTSGSTAQPKGVVVTHANLAAQMEAFVARHTTGPHSRVVSWLPMYHDMGLIGMLLPVVWAGMSTYLMAPDEFLRYPLRWIRLMSEHRADSTAAPDFAYALAARRAQERPAELAGIDLSAWTLAINGAEPVRSQTLRRFAEVFAPCGFDARAFHPAYGLAEATLQVSGSPPLGGIRELAVDIDALTQGVVAPTATADSARVLVSCGPPMPGMTVEIIDADRNPLAEGCVGEIRISGPNVSSGYFGRPDAEQPRRTGDLGFLHQGELYVTGRTKEMLIVRGRNYYPHDLERAVDGCHPALRPGGVAVFPDEADGFVVMAEARGRPDDTDLQAVFAAIREAIFADSGIVPTVSLLVSRGIEKTSSGKIQRHACRERWLSGQLTVIARDDAPGSAAAQPVELSTRPETSPLLATVLAEMAALGAHADPAATFGASGLDSLRMAELSARLAAGLGRPVPLSLLYGFPTPSRLAAALAGDSAHPAAGWEGALAGAAPTQAPLAILGYAVRVPGADDPEALWSLLAAGGDAISDSPHPAGRLGELPFQAATFRIPADEAADMADEQRLALLLVWEALADAGLDSALLAGRHVGVYVGASAAATPPRAVTPTAATGTALSLIANRIGFLLDLHGPSMVVDTACSSSLVALHLAASALRAGEIEAAIVLGVNQPESSGDAALEAAGFLADRCRVFDESAAGYVRSAGGVALVLSSERHAQTLGLGARGLLLGTAVTHGGRASSLTAPNPAAQADAVRRAWQMAGHPLAEARYIELHGTGTRLGDPIETQGLASLLPADRCLDAQGDRRLAVGAIKANLGHLEAAAGLAGLAKVLLAFAHRTLPPQPHLRQPNPKVPWDRLRIAQQPEPWEPGLAGVSAFGFGGTNAHAVLAPATRPPRSLPRPQFRVDTSVASSTPATPHDRARALVAAQLPGELVDGVPLRDLGLDSMGAVSLVAGFRQEFGITLSVDTLLDGADLARVLAPLGPEQRTAVPWLTGLMAAMTAAGEAPAVEDATGRSTHAELLTTALAVGAGLRATGQGPLIGVALDPSRESAAALLGIAAAGAAWVAVDPAWPEARRRAVWEDAGVTAVFAGPAVDLPVGITRLSVDALAVHAPLPPAPPGELAYLLYTSGSTGRPKGVEVGSLALSTHLDGILAALPDTPAPHWLALTSLSFDIALLELLAPLARGGRVSCLDPGLRRDGPALAAAVSSLQPTWMQATPSTYRMLVAAQWRGSPDLHLICGGEALDRPLAEALTERVAAVYNAYGPTEATIWATVGRVHGEVTLGTPLRGYLLRVVDEELWIGGDAVAQGYRHLPDATAARFLTDASGVRWYRTGDRVLERRDGALLYRGRFDEQVKISGQRAEPGEVEALLRADPGVREAAVKVIDGRFAAFYEGDASEAALRARLAAALPPALVPRVIHRMDALPRASSGKLDRAALVPPAVEEHENLGMVGRIEALFVEALGRPLAGDFFSSGGNSVAATTLLLRIREEFGRDVPFHALTEAPTPAALCAWLSAPAPGGPDLAGDAVLDASFTVNPPAGGDALLLTGSTGFVGTLLLKALITHWDGPILCMVRGDEVGPALPGSGVARRLGVENPRVEIVAGDLSRPDLGLTDRAALIRRTRLVVHNGALVNFVYPYAALRGPNVEGTRALLELAAEAGAAFHHVSSVAVFESETFAHADDVPEDADLNASVGLWDGYPQSKWVSEQLVHAAGARGLKVSIYRPGMVSGHSQTGACNSGDFIIRMIRGCAMLGIAPEIDTLVELVPVDYVAEAIARLVASGSEGVWHLTNPAPLHASDFIETIAELGYPVQTEPYDAWRNRVLASLPADNPLFPLLPFFATRASAVTMRLPRFRTERTEAALGDLTCPPVGAALVGRSLAWLREQGLLAPPTVPVS